MESAAEYIEKCQKQMRAEYIEAFFEALKHEKNDCNVHSDIEEMFSRDCFRDDSHLSFLNTDHSLQYMERGLLMNGFEDEKIPRLKKPTGMRIRLCSSFGTVHETLISVTQERTINIQRTLMKTVQVIQDALESWSRQLNLSDHNRSSDSDRRAKKTRREKLPLKFVNNRVGHSRQKLSKTYGRQNYNFH